MYNSNSYGIIGDGKKLAIVKGNHSVFYLPKYELMDWSVEYFRPNSMSFNLSIECPDFQDLGDQDFLEKDFFDRFTINDLFREINKKIKRR